MKKLIFLTIILFDTLCFAVAEEGYIHDQTKIWSRTGPSNDYKVKYKLSPGIKLEVLQKNEETGFIQIKDELGRVSWISSEFVSNKPTAGRLLTEARRALVNLKQNHEEKVSGLERQIKALQPLEQDNQSIKNELAKLQTEFETVSQEKQAYSGRFYQEVFISGAVVFLGGMFFGWLLSRLGGRSRGTWS